MATGSLLKLTQTGEARPTPQTQTPQTLQTAIRHCCSPFFAIDVASVLPFYLALAVPHSTAYLLALRAIRVLRLLRILKIGRHWFGVQIVGALVAHSSSALLLCFLFFVASTIVISSALWAIESEAHGAPAPPLGAEGGRRAAVVDEQLARESCV